MQRGQAHAGDHLAFPHERHVGFCHVAGGDDRGTEGLQQRLHRVEQRMAQRHDADLRTTLTLTTVAPFA